MRKRGRPRLDRPKVDLGTPETIFKRAFDLTKEPLDLCLERGFISDDEHRAGLHLRWLYTIRYGAPSISALDLSKKLKLEMRADDPKWREEREHEYNQAAEVLRKNRRYKNILALCVFNEMPIFLNRKIQENAITNSLLNSNLTNEINRTKDGLELLVKLWD